MRATFPRWPVWNYQFPQKDVRGITRIEYVGTDGNRVDLAKEHYRLAIGRNGVSVLVMLRKGELPAIEDRADAVTVEYEADA